MQSTEEPSFHWRTLLDGAARVEHPALRQPICLVVDDPMPGYNPAHFHSGFRLGPLRIPPDLIDRFADLVETTGIRGKFSVVPYPFGLGRVDQEVEGVSPLDLRHFLDVVRERLAPYLDISPEVLTHWNALDLGTGRLLPWWEHVWSRRQTRETLAPYLTLALEILGAVDLPASGMTSPWDFGAEVETDYAEALLDAQRAVNGRRLTWYFLHTDAMSRHVAPRVTVLRPALGEAVINVVACDREDFGAPLWRGDDPRPDALLTADGRGGRLAEVIRAGGPAVFHTHWQTIFGFGSNRGLDAIRLLAERLNTQFGDYTRWVRCQELAEYAAAAAAVTVTALPGGEAATNLAVSSPFTCREFTLSLDWNASAGAVQVNGASLRHVHDRAAIGEGTCLLEAGKLYLCWRLGGTQQITVRRA